MHAPFTEQPDQVQFTAPFFGAIDGFSQGSVCQKGTIADGKINARQVLVDNAACAQIQMAYFRVAHLPLWQADGFAGSI